MQGVKTDTVAGFNSNFGWVIAGGAGVDANSFKLSVESTLDGRTFAKFQEPPLGLDSQGGNSIEKLLV